MNFTTKHTLVCCLVCLRKVPVKVTELAHLGGSGPQSLCGQFLNFCCQYLKVDVSNSNKGDGGGSEIDIEPIGVDHLYSFIFAGCDDDDMDKVFCPQCSQMITELMKKYEEWMNVKARLLSSIRKLEEVLDDGTIKKRKARKSVAVFRNNLQQKCYDKTNGINPVVKVKKTTVVTLPLPPLNIKPRSRPQVLDDLECEREWMDVEFEASTWSPYSDSTSITPADWIGPTLSPPPKPALPPADNELDIKPDLEPPNDIRRRRRPLPLRKLFKRLSSSRKCKGKEREGKPVQRLTKRKEAHNCPQCDAKFKWKHILYQHQAIEHENIKNFLKCEACGKKLGNIRILLNHIQEKHENPEEINIYCPYCPESFTTQQLSLLHRRCMHSVYGRSPELFCEVENCYEKFLHVSDMNQHLATAHLQGSEMGKLYSCDLCGLDFLHPTRCRLHQFIHYEKDAEDYYKCPQYIECGVKYKKVRNIMNHFHQFHISPEHQVQVHRCSLCKTNCYFFSKNDLESHLKTHLIEVKCGLCGTLFQGHNELTAHRYLEHPEHPVVKKVQDLKKDRNINKELENNTCYTDTKTAAQQTYLTRRCGHCSKTFSTITELQRHKLKMHRVGSTFTRIVCEHCGKSVPKDVFPKHLLIHSASQVECPYQCGKKFPNAMQAHRHAKMHEKTPIPPPPAQDFVCEVCGKKYLTRSLINRHWKLVHEEKRYLCKVCGKRCGTITTFKEHVMAKHSEDKITCQWCSTQFKGANPDRDLLNHVKKTHTPEMLQEHMAKRRSWRYEMNVDKYLELLGGDEEEAGSSGRTGTVTEINSTNDKTDERNEDGFQLQQAAAVTNNSNWPTPNEFSEYILP